MAARVTLPYFSSLPSKRSNSVKASAVPPAKPASTLPSARRRTLRALPFMTVVPRVTWPSPPRAMAPLRRTPRMVVPCGSKWGRSFMGFPRLGSWSAAGLAGGSHSGQTQAVRQRVCLSLTTCPRVGSVVDAGKVLEVKVRVDLGSRDVGVTEQLLHPAQLPARFQQMRSKGMAEQVRMYVHSQPLPPGPHCHARLHRARAESYTVAADEQRVLVVPGERGALLEPAAQRAPREASDRHDAGLAALAKHVHHAVVEIEARDIEAHQLRETQPRGIEQLHQRAIARAETIALHRNL